MGTIDTRPDDDSRSGGVGTITRPGAESAAEPRLRRGGQARLAPAAPPSHVPPRRSGRPASHPVTRPGRTALPSPPDGATRPAADGAPRATAPRAMALRGQRMHFFFVLCGLLGGALICALVISTTLAEGTYQITRLQQSTSALAKQRQILQDEVATAQSAQVIEQRALQLGMRSAGELRFIDLKNSKIETDAGSGQVAQIHVPGYTP